MTRIITSSLGRYALAASLLTVMSSFSLLVALFAGSLYLCFVLVCYRFSLFLYALCQQQKPTPQLIKVVNTSQTFPKNRNA